MPTRLPTALLCVPVCFAIGCFSEPGTVPLPASTGAADTTAGSEDSTTQEPDDATSSSEGQAASSGSTTGLATFGTTGDTDFCEAENRTVNSFFDNWVNEMIPEDWFISDGVALQVPEGAGGTALRMARNLPANGMSWTLGQDIAGPFEPGETYEVEIRYRKAGGLASSTRIHVELDGAGFPSDNIDVLPGPGWKDAIAVLTLPEDVDGEPPQSMPLLISSFDNDQIIEFDSVFFFQACFSAP